MRRVPSFAVLLVCCRRLPASAQSVAFGGMQADISAPVELAADNLTVNQSTGQAEFTGNVLIGQGEMKLGGSGPGAICRQRPLADRQP